ncbi:MAG: hypothetical protein KW802_04080 [Candidatus Doudnabacteria bacterium]|nr:hypothetical protein [Candidatus Doudnabacteria bacterium]
MMPSDHVAIAAVLTFFLIRHNVNWYHCIWVALLSHYLSDCIPHAEPSLFNWHSSDLMYRLWVVVDHLLAAAIFLIYTRRYRFDNRYLLVAFFSWAPDLTFMMAEVFHQPMWIFASHLHSSSHILWRYLLNVENGNPASLLAILICFFVYVCAWFSPIYVLDLAPRKRHWLIYDPLQP